MHGVQLVHAARCRRASHFPALHFDVSITTGRDADDALAAAAGWCGNRGKSCRMRHAVGPDAAADFARLATAARRACVARTEPAVAVTAETIAARLGARILEALQAACRAALGVAHVGCAHDGAREIAPVRALGITLIRGARDDGGIWRARQRKGRARYPLARIAVSRAGRRWRRGIGDP